MFRTLIYPLSWACENSVELPHWSYCSWFDVCWSFGVVGLEWYPCCRLIMSLRLFCWITTLVVLFLVQCVLEFRCGWVGVVSVLQASAIFETISPGSFLGKAAGAVQWPLTHWWPVKERVQLYCYCPSRPSPTVIGRPLSLPLFNIHWNVNGDEMKENELEERVTNLGGEKFRKASWEK